MLMLPKREKEETLAKMAIFLCLQLFGKVQPRTLKFHQDKRQEMQKIFLARQSNISNKNQMNENIYISTFTD